MKAPELSGLLASDGVHPNERGYQYWGQHIADEVVPCLKRKPQAKRVSQPSVWAGPAGLARRSKL